MRRLHPLWRGFWLATALVLTLTLYGSTDVLSPYRLERKPLALFAAVVAGAFFAWLPGRFRKGRVASNKVTWQRCLLAFCCGVVMALALGAAGDGRIVFALMQGSVGAFAFVAVAWLTGFVTVRIAGRRNRT